MALSKLSELNHDEGSVHVTPKVSELKGVRW